MALPPPPPPGFSNPDYRRHSALAAWQAAGEALLHDSAASHAAGGRRSRSPGRQRGCFIKVALDARENGHFEKISSLNGDVSSGDNLGSLILINETPVAS